MTKKLPILVAIGILLFTIFVIFSHAKQVLSAASHVVISEVQLAGGTTTDEFVELYNPTGSAVSLTNWKLSKKTAGGTESDLVSSLSGTIPALGYFLIAHTSYDGTPSADSTFSAQSLANDNTVLLYDATSTVVDKIGLGTATDKETTTVANPSANHSVERKANASATTASMGPSGSDEMQGNSEDTDVNSVDFVSRNTAEPQNSTSAVEPKFELTPTNSPQPSITPTQEPTVSPTPTDELTPTSTPSPTQNPTRTPTPTEEPPTTLTPTAEPTATIWPTTTPTPISTGTPSPTPTVWPHPTPKPVTYWNPLFQCTITYRPLRIFHKVIFFPKITCIRNEYHTDISQRGNSKFD